MREDRHVGEDDIAGGVVEMAMRVDQHADRLAGLGLDGGAKLARQPRILLRVDREQPVRSLDRARIGIAAGADPGIDAIGDGQELRLHGFPPVAVQHAAPN